MPKFNPNNFKKYVSKLDIENPQHQRKALKYVLDRSEYKPSERKTILKSFDEGDYDEFLIEERRSASWDDFAKYRNVYHTIEEGLPGVHRKNDHYTSDNWIPFNQVSSRYYNAVAKREQNEFLKRRQEIQQANQTFDAIQNYDPTSYSINPNIKVPFEQKPYVPFTAKELKHYQDNSKIISVNGKIVRKNSSMTRFNTEASQKFRELQANASSSMDVEAEAYVKAYNNKPLTSNMGFKDSASTNTHVSQPSEESVDNTWKKFINWTKEYEQSTSNSKSDASGFGHIRKNVIGPSEESVDNKHRAKEYKQSTSNTTQPLQSGPISANDFAAMSGSSNKASDYMGKRLARRYNETDAKIKAIQDNADLSEADKTKQINDIYAVFGDNVKNMNDVQQSLFEQAKRGPSAWDYAMGYEVPQAITGVALLGGMASMALGNSKGQKTNAELYSNPF